MDFDRALFVFMKKKLGVNCTNFHLVLVILPLFKRTRIRVNSFSNSNLFSNRRSLIEVISNIVTVWMIPLHWLSIISQSLTTLLSMNWSNTVWKNKCFIIAKMEQRCAIFKNFFKRVFQFLRIFKRIDLQIGLKPLKSI